MQVSIKTKERTYNESTVWIRTSVTEYQSGNVGSFGRYLHRGLAIACEVGHITPLQLPGSGKQTRTVTAPRIKHILSLCLIGAIKGWYGSCDGKDRPESRNDFELPNSPPEIVRTQ